MGQPLSATEAKALADAISSLESDFSFLDRLVAAMAPPLVSGSANISIRAHYLPFRNGRAMTGELLDVIRAYICNFALSRAEIADVHATVKMSSPQEAMIAYNRLRDSAADIFIKAQKSTNRNGECGELLLYLLIEWILKAPQVVAKMSLKTSGAMPVHGSDGIHVKFDDESGKLWFVWGESKLHATLDGALKAAVTSVAEALKFEKQKTDIGLVRRNFDVSGLPASVKQSVLDHLNPLKEAYLNKLDVSACLIGFNFDGFATISGISTDKIESTFVGALHSAIEAEIESLTKLVQDNKLEHHRLELFFIPFESVDRLRIDFQNLIGWKS